MRLRGRPAGRGVHIRRMTFIRGVKEHLSVECVTGTVVQGLQVWVNHQRYSKST
jgi:hypothetical protein